VVNASSKLVKQRARGYISGMSVAEIIEQIKTLPAEEQAKVAEFLRECVSGQEAASPRIMEDAAFNKAADATFSKHDELLKKLAL
jgi:hypothetical protein